ncbi:DTW domain-containing protein 1, partial [Perkinsus olseni]
DFNPEFDLDSTVLLYPGEDSKSIDEVDWSKIKRVAVIDCTWHQTGYMLRIQGNPHNVKVCCALSHPSLKNLPKVGITSHATNFWRYQHEGPECLATVEACYLLCKEQWEAVND